MCSMPYYTYGGTANFLVLRPIVTFGLKTPLHVLGEHTGMKAELYQSNIKIQGLSIESRSSTSCTD